MFWQYKNDLSGVVIANAAGDLVSLYDTQPHSNKDNTKKPKTIPAPIPTPTPIPQPVQNNTVNPAIPAPKPPA